MEAAALTIAEQARADLAVLTPRQRDCLVLASKGLTNPEIGHGLRMSRHTVSDHMKLIYAALGVGSRAEAAVIAAKAEWV